MKKLTILLLFITQCLTTFSQSEDSVISRQTNGITVTASSNYQPDGWSKSASGNKTIDQSGLEGKLDEASRLLIQASFGGNLQTIEQVADMGIEPWIEEQMKMEPSLIYPLIQPTYDEYKEDFIANGGNPDEFPWRPWRDIYSFAWWENNMRANDLLRQRIAFALSEILVISVQSDLGEFGDGVASYYDIFNRNAFGNYKDILMEVTLHPAMGYYLSHLDNPKADPELNTHPDENYAREVMQLFSIGLYELNEDGTRKIDGNGNFIPTYQNSDIKEFAKVFTGLGIGAVVENEWVDEPDFGYGIWIADMNVPMKMYQEYHEPGEKHLLNGFVIPAGQSGMADIEQTINHLFNHPNVGPFIGRKLIQLLVKSNPTPEYIASVTAAFNDNGSGVRGDMKAVIKAILLHPEARECSWMNDPVQGKLLEPFIRYAQFTHGIGTNSPSGKYWNHGYYTYENLKQYPLASPSVFNFFLPDFQPNGPIADAGLFAPEFQIHNSQTSIGYVNMNDIWAIDEFNFWSWEDPPKHVYTDFSWLVEDAQDTEVLINKLDLVLTHGTLSEETRAIIKQVIEPYQGGVIERMNRIHLAAYLIMISPDYVILK